MKNFFYWIKKPSTIYNYSSLIGDGKTGKHKDHAPRWVIFLLVLLVSTLFSSILLALLAFKDTSFIELITLIPNYLISFYFIFSIILVIIPAFFIHFSRTLKRYNEATTLNGKILRTIPILLTILIVIYCFIFIKAELHNFNIEKERKASYKEINRIKVEEKNKIVVPQINQDKLPSNNIEMPTINVESIEILKEP